MVVLVDVRPLRQKRQSQREASTSISRRHPLRFLLLLACSFFLLCWHLRVLHAAVLPDVASPAMIHTTTLVSVPTTAATKEHPRASEGKIFDRRREGIVHASLALPSAEEEEKRLPIETNSIISKDSSRIGQKERIAEASVDLASPSLQVFLVTAPANKVYRERFLVNAKGWHREFPDLQVFTFDEVPTNVSSLDGVNIRRIQRLPVEEHKKGTNLLLAAFGAIYEYNPNADFYFLTEDDTILVKQNIDEAVRRLAHRNDVYIGRCARIKTQTLGVVDFIMGGPGILMSGDMLRRMAPGIMQCRAEYNEFQHGDVRIAACLRFVNISYSENFCNFAELQSDAGLHFTSTSAWRAASIAEAPAGKVVTLHEKKLERIDVLNDAIKELTNQQHDITWGSLKPYLDKFAGNRTDMY